MDFKKAAIELVAQMTLDEKISQMCNNAPAIERLGIPAYDWWSECLHGLGRSGAATVFPQSIGMAATFNTHLMERVASVISDEARAKYNEYKKLGGTKMYQGITMCAPNINIARDPRWGRTQETYGEDPYLTGEMGVAFIRGLQSDGKYRKIDATLKHYAVHSGPETERHGFSANVDENDLRETYLWAFRYCIENAKPSAVMGAYSAVNGQPCVASKWLLKDILCSEFGFDGYVESDNDGVNDLHGGHHVTANVVESAALAVNNGCHLNIGDTFTHLPEAVKQGLICEETITKAVEKLFEARFRLGMFSSDCEYDQIPYDVIECSEHLRLSREMAQESIVLLKNDGILPLKSPCSLAVIGPTANDRTVLLGNYNGNPTRMYTLLDGILEAAEGRVYHAQGCDISREGLYYKQHSLEDALVVASKADVIILCMGLNPSLEDEDQDRDQIELPACQQKLFKAIRQLGKPMIFVNVSGSCVALGEQDYACNAVIQCFYPGAEGGRALSDVLFGKISPSGRLPITFYGGTGDLPPFVDYSMENRTYRFFKGKPVYPFGHGLTYSCFEYTQPLRKAEQVSVTVKNVGECAAAEVVQVYGGTDDIRLIGFEKCMLQPGEEKKVCIDIAESAARVYVGGGHPEYARCFELP